MTHALEVKRSLTAVPLNWVTWSYELREDDALVATIKTEWWGECGTLTIADKTWRLERAGWMHGAFSLKQGGKTFATAEKPGALFRSFQITFDQEFLTWEAESPLNRAFVLRKGNQVIGSMRPESMFTRQAKLDLPQELTLERKAFLVWLAVLMWRRAQSSS